ncbi:hypothetical protein PLESTF_000132600 [Pleodorina starrii]|nr:hypothetical protein PLESTF_000132600 [Pleodorina starrii]
MRRTLSAAAHGSAPCWPCDVDALPPGSRHHNHLGSQAPCNSVAYTGNPTFPGATMQHSQAFGPGPAACHPGRPSSPLPRTATNCTARGPAAAAAAAAATSGAPPPDAGFARPIQRSVSMQLHTPPSHYGAAPPSAMPQLPLPSQQQQQQLLHVPVPAMGAGAAPASLGRLRCSSLKRARSLEQRPGHVGPTRGSCSPMGVQRTPTKHTAAGGPGAALAPLSPFASACSYAGGRAPAPAATEPKVHSRARSAGVEGEGPGTARLGGAGSSGTTSVSSMSYRRLVMSSISNLAQLRDTVAEDAGLSPRDKQNLLKMIEGALEQQQQRHTDQPQQQQRQHEGQQQQQQQHQHQQQHEGPSLCSSSSVPQPQYYPLTHPQPQQQQQRQRQPQQQPQASASPQLHSQHPQPQLQPPQQQLAAPPPPPPPPPPPQPLHSPSYTRPPHTLAPNGSVAFSGTWAQSSPMPTPWTSASATASAASSATTRGSVWAPTGPCGASHQQSRTTHVPAEAPAVAQTMGGAPTFGVVAAPEAAPLVQVLSTTSTARGGTQIGHDSGGNPAFIQRSRGSGSGDPAAVTVAMARGPAATYGTHGAAAGEKYSHATASDGSSHRSGNNAGNMWGSSPFAATSMASQQKHMSAQWMCAPPMAAAGAASGGGGPCIDPCPGGLHGPATTAAAAPAPSPPPRNPRQVLDGGALVYDSPPECVHGMPAAPYVVPNVTPDGIARLRGRGSSAGGAAGSSGARGSGSGGDAAGGCDGGGAAAAGGLSPAGLQQPPQPLQPLPLPKAPCSQPAARPIPTPMPLRAIPPSPCNSTSQAPPPQPTAGATSPSGWGPAETLPLLAQSVGPASAPTRDVAHLGCTSAATAPPAGASGAAGGPPHAGAAAAAAADCVDVDSWIPADFGLEPPTPEGGFGGDATAGSWSGAALGWAGGDCAGGEGGAGADAPTGSDELWGAVGCCDATQRQQQQQQQAMIAMRDYQPSAPDQQRLLQQPVGLPYQVPYAQQEGYAPLPPPPPFQQHQEQQQQHERQTGNLPLLQSPSGAGGLVAQIGSAAGGEEAGGLSAAMGLGFGGDLSGPCGEVDPLGETFHRWMEHELGPEQGPGGELDGVVSMLCDEGL